jgi:alpha-2-macroglobulin
MMKPYVLLYLLFSPLFLPGQDITHSRTSSHYTNIYKISDQEAHALLMKKRNAITRSTFHTWVDAYPADSIYKKEIVPGHYLHVNAINDQLEVTYRPVNNLTMQILDNSRDLLLIFFDNNGKELKANSVKINNRSIPLDKKLNAYRLEKTNRQGWVMVSFEGHTNFFDIYRTYNNTLLARTKRTALNRFQLRHVISPVTYTYKSVKSLIKWGHLYPPGIYYRVQRWIEPRTFGGYFVLNKPKYLPGDTVQFKTFITRRKGQPIKKRLDVYLTGGSYNANPSRRLGYQRKKIGEVRPYRPGAYSFDFILDDSLKLVLDQQYTISLEGRGYANYPDGSFSYEQYELNQNFFSLTTAPANRKNVPATLVLKGTDSNEMPLFDIRVQLYVKTKQVNDFFEKEVRVKDTLWVHQLKLESLGDTRVTLPDSIYPLAHLDYEVDAVFINTENERQIKSVSLSYHAKKPGQIECRNDSVVFTHTNSGEYKIIGVNKNEQTILRKNVILPFTSKIEPAVSRYALWLNGEEVETLRMNDVEDMVALLANRTHDSLFVTLQNPRKLAVRYQVFKNNRIVQEGIEDTFTIKRKTSPADQYYFSLQYVWAGDAKEQNYELPIQKRSLKISVNQPATVFPGQTNDVMVDVKDGLGRPVKDADLTAYAITRKFIQAQVPEIPNFEKYKRRKAFNSFREKTRQTLRITKKLDYDFWKNKLGLDSIQYYHFLYPTNGWFRQEVAVADSITQIAPFVVKDGVIQPVYYIYFGSEVKYYHEVETVTPYSFRADKEVGIIKIRLRKQLLSISNVPIVKGKKLIFSIDLDQLLPHVTSQEKPDRLDEDEIKKLRPHFMWVNRDINQSNAFLKQDNSIHLFRPLSSYQFQSDLAGPFFPGSVHYHSNFELAFPFKPQMVYTFKPHLVDRESMNFNPYRKLYWQNRYHSVKDQVLTEERVLAIWKSQEKNKAYRFRKYPDNHPGSKIVGGLVMRHKFEHPEKAFRLGTFILNLDHQDEYYIFPPDNPILSPLLPGLYQCAVIYSDNSYIKSRTVTISPFSTLYLNLSEEPLLPPDDFSREVTEKIREWSEKNEYVEQHRRQEMQTIRQLYYQETSQDMFFSGGRWVSGVITDEERIPIPGVNVIVKGTTIGTVSDADGYYRIYVPYSATLVFSFIGFTTTEADAGNRSEVDVQLAPDVTQLSEVVVTAYGVSTEKKAMAYSVSSVSTLLQGKIPGVSVNGRMAPVDSIGIQIRGVSSVEGGQPLVIIDGVLRNLSDIDPNKISIIEILKGKSAVAIYGARAENGVILISTIPGITRAQLLETRLPDTPMMLFGESAPGSSLRKNFRDYAFWQPALRTDEQGKVSFRVTYPDDITGWNIHVLGMASRKRTGSVSTHVQSFKPLVAQLAMPHFLIAGDHSIAIGKITNYSADSVSVSRTLQVNNNSLLAGNVTLKNSLIDSVALTGITDSLTVKYEIAYNAYRDGELKKIPVLPKGDREVRGIFAALPVDTTFRVSLNKSSTIRLSVQADMLDVLMDEIEVVRAYSLDCNEQVASKLKVLLAEKSIKALKKDKFSRDREIEKLIRKLVSNQAKDGSWGWWGMRGGSMWITLHVAEALQWAEKSGYSTLFDKRALKDFLMYPSPPDLSAENQLRAWVYLSQQGEKVMARSLVDTLAKRKQLSDRYYQLLAARLLQLQGIEPDWEVIERQKQKTLKGNVYWGEEKPSMWNNDIDNTLLVYQMFEHRQADHPDLLRIRNYFLERRNRSWRNTYESARIIEVLLPGLMRTYKHDKPAMLSFSGDFKESISQFPYQKEFTNVQQIHVTKTGNSPLYFTAYEEIWEPEPARVVQDFVVNLDVEEPSKWKAGETVRMKVNLEVKKDAEFVMIQIPIPAGCSYQQKEQSRKNGEVHREYDLHETRIYCERLRAGTYEYTIQLIPRYKGSYHLNPAKASWMYFPVIYGREEMKEITIE